MVSDTDMGTEQEESDMEERESSDSGSMEMSEGSSSGEMGAESAAPASTKSKSKGGGRRAALRILRENVDSVSKDLASFRKNHEANTKKLDKQVASLRNEVASLKSFISKENVRVKGKQEALLNRIIAKMNEKPKAPARPKKKAAPKKSKKK